MKVLTWNVYKDNKKMSKLILQLQKEDADIVCLQEVPERFLEKLSGMYEFVVSSNEGWTYRKTGEEILILNVILSKFEISHVFTQDISLHTLFEARKYKQFSSEFISATINVKGINYEVSNTHLRCVAPPWVRVKQFEEILKNIDTNKRNIICGDLNTFSWPLLNLLIWKRYSYTFKEIWTNGRKIFDTIFTTHNLVNPHRGVGTFKLFPVQYDYILVDKEIVVNSSQKIKQLSGSDHYGLVIDVD